MGSWGCLGLFMNAIKAQGRLHLLRAISRLAKEKGMGRALTVSLDQVTQKS